MHMKLHYIEIYLKILCCPFCHVARHFVFHLKHQNAHFHIVKLKLNFSFCLCYLYVTIKYIIDYCNFNTYQMLFSSVHFHLVSLLSCMLNHIKHTLYIYIFRKYNSARHWFFFFSFWRTHENEIERVHFNAISDLR